MRKDEQTDVLVVGAGPVGMLTAILLAEHGVEVLIVDQEIRRASRSYACGLHPRTLKLLDEAGLAAPLLERGRRVETIIFYERQAKAAELKLGQLSGDFPFLLLVPQNELEGVLEERLRQHDKIKVRWNHRLTGLAEVEGRMLASVDKLAETATGYIVPTWDWVVEKTIQTRAYYVVGADGQHSQVRHSLGLEMDPAGPSEHYEVFEFDCEHEVGHDALVVFDESGASVMWPLGDRRCRWGFQQPPSPDEDFPDKSRDLAQVAHEGDAVARRLPELLAARAPFWKAGVREIVWAGQVQFTPRLARAFGRDRSWLAGDAGHQTGPIGLQSLNAGLFEAGELAGKIRSLLFNEAQPEILADYDAGRRAEWRQLLGLDATLAPGATASPWARKHSARLLSCLPGTGEDLRRLAAQLGLVLEP